MKKTLSLPDDHFLVTELKTNHPQTAAYRAREILSWLQSTHSEYRDRRESKTQRMMESWGIYLNSEEANDWLRRKALATVGTSQDWQHHIQDGLGFRTIETIVAYLMGAFFPNDDWFDITPEVPIEDEDYLLYMKVMKQYIKVKMRQSHIRERVEGFLRQLSICGTSALALPWRFETVTTRKNVRVRENDEEIIRVATQEKTIANHPELEVLDIFDFWLDPDSPDPNQGNFVRKISMSRGELTRLIRDEYYDLADENDIKDIPTNVSPGSNTKADVDAFGGITNSINPNSRVDVFEFWGTICLDSAEYQDVVATWAGDTLLRFESSPYWAGRPFIFATYTPNVSSPYGIGALEPIRGLLHEKNSIKNQRLDAGALSLNPMYEFINDGTFDASGFFTEPGKMIPVSALGSTIRPITFDRGYHSISVNEEQSLGNDIEMTTGTGAFIGTSPGRSGERVTAQEVQQSRDAGGTRLSSTHAHLEEQFLTRLLTKYYRLCQQFQIEEEVIPVSGNSAEEIWYVRVGIDQLGIDFYFKPLGAAHIADKEFELRNMLDWVAAVNQVPEMAQVVNWPEVCKELTKRFLRLNPERFLSQPKAPEAPTDPAMPPPTNGISPEGADPMAAVLGEAKKIGGNELANFLAAQEQAAPGMQQASLAASGPPMPLPPGIDPEAALQAVQP